MEGAASRDGRTNNRLLVPDTASIEQQIEALIFASEQSISLTELQEIIQTVNEQAVDLSTLEEYIQRIEEKYADPSLAISLQRLNNGYQFLTKPDYYPYINQLQLHRSKKKLSQAALETLSIIAYRQPITKVEIEQIRGVNCDYSIHKLLEKELISILGKSKNVGRPLLYGVSPLFMDYFGINSTADLPKLKDILAEGENSIGAAES